MNGDAISQPALKVRGLHKEFGRFVALDSVDLTVNEGEIRAIIGPNGAGKTTLINVLGGQIVADRGSVEVAGRTRWRSSAWAAHTRYRAPCGG